MSMKIVCSCGNEMTFENKVNQDMPDEFTFGLDEDTEALSIECNKCGDVIELS